MKEITVDALIDNIPQVTAFVETELQKNNCPGKTMMQIDVAIDELFSNIAYYAYGEEQGQVTVQLQVTQDPPQINLSFIDSGMAYNPLENQDPDVTLSLEERQIGGLGIFMVKKSMDEVSYKRQAGNNILTITKKFT